MENYIHIYFTRFTLYFVLLVQNYCCVYFKHIIVKCLKKICLKLKCNDCFHKSNFKKKNTIWCICIIRTLPQKLQLYKLGKKLSKSKIQSLILTNIENQRIIVFSHVTCVQRIFNGTF